MPSIVKEAVRTFFRRDLQLRRTAAGLRVVMLAADGSEPPPTAAEREAERVARELQCVREQLAALLDDGGDRRPQCRHLAYVEHALGKRGFRAVELVPLPVLKTALEQFERLVSNWSREGLACLRSKMAVALHARRDERPDADSLHTAALLQDPTTLAAQTIAAAARTPAAPSADAESEDDEAAALRAAYAALGVEPAGAAPA